MPTSFVAAPVDSRSERRLNMKVEYNNDRHTGPRPSLLSPSLFCRISVSVFRTLSPYSNRRVGLYRQQKTPNQCRAGDSPFGSACFFPSPLTMQFPSLNSLGRLPFPARISPLNQGYFLP